MTETRQRRPLISGNWKMNFDHLEALHAARDLGLRLQPADAGPVDISIHPPFTDIRTVQSVIEPDGIPVALGAQNCAVEDAGAFTGEVSPLMLAKLHVEYVIVGHSERRRLFGETDEMVAAKLRAVLRNGMTPICCVGETVDEREAGMTKDRLAGQVEAALGGLPPRRWPAWSSPTSRCGPSGPARRPPPRTPRTPASGSARSSAGAPTSRRPARSGSSTGVRCTEDNTESLLSCPDVDGALVGGASLDMAAFVGIIRAAARAAR